MPVFPSGLDPSEGNGKVVCVMDASSYVGLWRVQTFCNEAIQCVPLCRETLDEDIYTFFEPELPFDKEVTGIGRLLENKACLEKRTGPKPNAGKSGSKGVRNKVFPLSPEKGPQSRSNNSKDWGMQGESVGWHEGSSVLDLKGENYFSCAVGRKRSNARYSLASSEEVVTFIKAMEKGYAEAGTNRKDVLR